MIAALLSGAEEISSRLGYRPATTTRSARATAKFLPSVDV